jgi:hypothetical protein
MNSFRHGGQCLLATVVCWLCLVIPSKAGNISPHFFANSTLFVDFIDPNFPNKQRSMSDSGIVSARVNDSFSFSPPGLGVTEQGSATAFALDRFSNILGATAQVSSFGDTRAVSSATWNDAATLSFAGTGSAPPFLTEEFLIHGIVSQFAGSLLAPSESGLTIAVGPPTGGGTNAEVDLIQTETSNQIQQTGLSNFSSTVTATNEFGAPTTFSFLGTFFAQIDLASEGLGLATYGPFNAKFGAFAQTSGGFAKADGQDTVSLVSVALPDGHTPESEGFTLSFESGLGSPNLPPAAAPDPSSLTLLGIGVVGLLVRGWRRGKKAC